MGGRSNRSGAKGVINTVFDPAGSTIHAAMDATGVSKIPIFNAATNFYRQPSENLWNVVEGKEQFGAHENWFGDGAFGDAISPIFGGTTTAQRQEARDQEIENQQAWKDWSARTGRKNPYGFGGDDTDRYGTAKKHKKPGGTSNTKQSLLFGGDDDSDELI